MATSIDYVTSNPEAFPEFSSAEFEAIAPVCEHRHYHAGQTIIAAGTPKYECCFVQSGEVQVLDVSGDEPVEVVVHQAGQFVGDIDLLTGRPAVIDVIALSEVDVLCVKPENLRAFLVKFPRMGDRMVEAFVQRRRLLTQSGFKGIRVYGHKDCDMTLLIHEFLYRNGIPHQWMDIELPDVQERMAKLNLRYEDTPYIACGKAMLFQQPTLKQIAHYYGLQRDVRPEGYDVVILGCGPAGLGAAVYASSEGLATLVVDNIGPGGQAGSSSKIENYAGFPSGVSGRELALRAYLQALKFGTDFVAPSSATDIRKEPDGRYAVELCTGQIAHTKSIIIATGINYRKLRVDGMERLRGSGIFYNATQIEAIMCEGKPVHVIGAGNSAGQAAMFLSGHCAEVNLLIRGDRIAKSMSEYLWSRVEQNPNIHIRYQCEMRAIEGEDRIEAIQVYDNTNGQLTREPTNGVFIFIGGTPCTDFLPPEIARDDKGFILAGVAVAQSGLWHEDDPPCELETTLPGVFVCGDCRAGTTKRVAFAIGDGALAVTCVHQYLGTYS